MKYMLLIHQGDSPTPRSPDAWETLSVDEQKAVYADYQALNQTPGVTPGLGLAAPETATTVRVQGGVAFWEGQTDVVQHKGAATRMAKAAGALQVVNNIKISDPAKAKAAENLAQGRRRAQVKRGDPRTQ